MKTFISKTTFKNFLECPKNTWLKNNRPDLEHLFTPSEFAKHLFEQGNEAESEAQKLFPNATLINSTGDDAVQDTQQTIEEKVSPIFQATFAVDGLYAKLDVLEYDSTTSSWNMYEIKGSSSVKDEGRYNKGDHITDAAFQALVLQKEDISINKCFLIHLNKEYVRNGDLNVHELFCIEDETEKILTRVNEIKDLVDASKEYLSRDVEPKGGCDCVYKTRTNHCATFKISNPSISEYGVHDISRIHKTKLELLMERGNYEMSDIPEDFKLSDRQKTQVQTATSNRSEIDEDAIREQLDSLIFPLYFLDYEGILLAIPRFEGHSPNKQMPFQFSVHVLDSPDAELKEYGYLHEEMTDPSEPIYKALKSVIGTSGNVVVWSKSYEKGINTKLGELIPASASFFEDINNRLYDLRDIFEKQLYIHPKAQGRSSLKKVLPAVAPELSYKELSVQDGAQAMSEWWKMISKESDEKVKLKIAEDLRKYCSMDTYAMYAIWKHLKEII